MTRRTLSDPGTLVHVRGREWVVLPHSTDDLLMLRPLGGLDEEIVGVLPKAEPVSSASFSLPSEHDVGDSTSGLLLREAARLSTRAAAGPFRSFGRVAVEPRPYQLVPLMMALRLNPIRLLIADDVGIGKTVEASLIARELLDRGEINRVAVLCPPHLAEQWQHELAEKFHIEAELVLSSTIQRLERDLPLGVSVFDRHRFTVVSTDFIKSPRRAEDFALKCPEFVIVDEAHGCTLSGGVGKGRQLRFDLLRRISQATTRHLVLVTATPHSGNEDAFRSLLSLIDSDFGDLPTDMERAEREGLRRKLARHLVQRRRADIRHYLDSDTSFPDRKDKEATYGFDQEYRKLFDDVLAFAREYVAESDGSRRQRVRYWSALALLRCVSSSPAAAVATLRSRASVEQAEDSEVDEEGRRTVLDQGDDDEVLAVDFSPGSDTETTQDTTRRKLLDLARRMEAIVPSHDPKLQAAVGEIKALIQDGFRPVVFCRFVDTAEYVARYLREVLPTKVRVEAVTGLLPAEERESRIAGLVSDSERHVLVCTDCLSEGVNLQQHFDAVLHYDLAWNPTRHEQREGRVDRFGQKKREVRVVTFYGADNPIDGVILEVLIRKHKAIKSDLGVAVSVPGSSEQVAQALFEGALFRQRAMTGPLQRRLFDDEDAQRAVTAFHGEWENARDREKASRSRYAQHTLSPEVVSSELASVRNAIGRSEEVAKFVRSVLQAASTPCEMVDGGLTVHLSQQTPRSLRQAIGRDDSFTGRFELPLAEGQIYLGRTSPIVEGLAGWTLDQALDSEARDGTAVAARCGIMSTSEVTTRTTLFVVRIRYHLTKAGSSTDTLLVEEIIPLACKGSPDSPDWLEGAEGERLLNAKPDRNLLPTAIQQQLGLLIPALPRYQSALETVARSRAALHLAAHERVREAARVTGRVTIQPVLPVDILGSYLLLPRIS